MMNDVTPQGFQLITVRHRELSDWPVQFLLVVGGMLLKVRYLGYSNWTAHRFIIRETEFTVLESFHRKSRNTALTHCCRCVIGRRSRVFSAESLVVFLFV